MTPPSDTARRSRRSLTESLGLSERVFASAEERRMVAEIEAGLDRVELGLETELHFTDDLADTTARYLFDAGGKRVRPALLLLIAQLGDGATPEAVSAAQVVELTHLATLYHDDVMDEAPLRRGIRSAHKVWGNSVAILTGDLLFARASRMVARLGENAIKLQASTFERLCLGQLHETMGPREGEDPVQHYLQVLSDKTGSLIALAARMGIVFSGASAEYTDAVVSYGEKVGVAFQLLDDVIDLSPRPAETGKRAGTDLLSGVATYPVLRLRELAATDPAAAALAARLPMPGDEPPTSAEQTAAERAELDAAIAELREHPATEETVVEARRWADAAVAALEPLPDGPVVKGLVQFARRVVERTA